MARVRWVSPILLLCLYSLLYTEAIADDSTTQCISGTPLQLPRDVAARLCLYAAPEGLADGPAQCAAAALRTSPLGSTTSTNADLANDIVELCEQAADTQPADCWSAAMTSQLYRSRRWRNAVVNVCKSAASSLPAQCILEFKSHGLSIDSTSPRQETTMETVTGICKAFQGDVSAIGACLTRAPRSLTEFLRFRLCRKVNGSNVADVVDCAKQLLQRNTNSEIVTRVCASAASPYNQPQKCVLAAQQQLRWMDASTVGHLCKHSRGTAAPVHCATALRSWFIAQFTRDHPLLDLARLCHGAVDADAIVTCVKTLPSQLFQPAQIVRLCVQTGVGDARARADCVVHAKQQLSGSSFRYQVDDDSRSTRDQHALLLMALCGDANTSSNPLACLVSTATQSPAFSAEERGRLCQHATSAAPHQCFRAIHSTLLARFSHHTADGIELCRRATTLAPAACVNQLHRQSPTLFQSGLALELCTNATSTAPAKCFAMAPHAFSDHEKIVLCAQAVSEAPATCAKVFLPRVKQNLMMAQLCARAVSTGPARCAGASPFGMDAHAIRQLCRQANDEKPAQCARAAPPYLKLPWHDVAAVCQHAKSTTPGSCLAHRVRQRIPLNQRLINECRVMNATTSTIEIVQFAYDCSELLPRCLITLKARVLDQFGDEMSALSHGYVHFTAVPDAEEDLKEPVLRGTTVAPIQNGSVVFRQLHFTVAGNFTLRLSTVGVEDMVARLYVRSNETERRQHDQCERVFSFMQCGLPQPPVRNPTLQILQLPHRWALAGLQCESLWTDQHAGLKPLGEISNAKLYAMPRVAYQLLTGDNIPTVTMQAWECLGIPEGSNRSTIRRAYHMRSLEWHPDKWFVTGDVASTAALRSKVEAVYARITAAYQQLLHQTVIDP